MTNRIAVKTLVRIYWHVERRRIARFPLVGAVVMMHRRHCLRNSGRPHGIRDSKTALLKQWHEYGVAERVSSKPSFHQPNDSLCYGQRSRADLNSQATMLRHCSNSKLRLFTPWSCRVPLHNILMCVPKRQIRCRDMPDVLAGRSASFGAHQTTDGCIGKIPKRLSVNC